MVFLASVIIAQGATQTWDLTATGKSWSTPTSSTLTWGATGFNDATPYVTNALAAATSWLAGKTNSTAYISFGTGTYVFEYNPNNNLSSINISNYQLAGSGNQVVIEGQGGLGTTYSNGSEGPGATNLMFEMYQDASGATGTLGNYVIGGTNASGFTFTNMRLGMFASLTTGGTPTGPYVGMVTQGQVYTIGGTSGAWTIEVVIPPSFPTIPEVWAASSNPRCYVRPFTYDGNGAPHLTPGVPSNTNPQIAWNGYSGPQTIGGTSNIWTLTQINGRPTYPPGTWLAIKSKHGPSPRFGAFSGYFNNVTNITLSNLRFTDGAGELWFYGSSNNITCTNCEGDRGAQIGSLTPCLASNGNGFTMQNNPGSTQTGITVTDNNFTGFGDDSVALQTDSTTATCQANIDNNTFTDDFARGINITTTSNYTNLLEQAGGIETTGNTYIDCYSNPSWPIGGTGNLP